LLTRAAQKEPHCAAKHLSSHDRHARSSIGFGNRRTWASAADLEARPTKARCRDYFTASQRAVRLPNSASTSSVRTHVLAAGLSSKLCSSTPGAPSLARARALQYVFPVHLVIDLAAPPCHPAKPGSPPILGALRTARTTACATASAAATPKTFKSACASPSESANTTSPSNMVFTG
jgi:hypothetical protein